MNTYPIGRIGLALLVAGLLGLGIVRFRDDASTRAPVIDYGHVPPFVLTDSSGREVTLRNFQGRVWIADFIFTSCAGTCPLMTGEMKKLQATLPAEILLASFTVDPLRDTPEVLSVYAKRAGADPVRWLFMTGSRQALYDLSIKGFKLGVDDTQGSAEEPITHSSRFALIGKDSRIIGFYGATEPEDMKQLVEDARKLL